MLDWLTDYDFLLEALIVAVMIGISAPLIGVFAVTRRVAHISGALSHMTLAGIALGAVVGDILPLPTAVPPPVYGTLFAFAGAFLVEWLRDHFKGFADAAIPAVLSCGIGLGTVIFNIVDGYNNTFYNALFGNLLAATHGDVIMTVIATIMALVFIIIFYHTILVTTFDRELAKVNPQRYRLGNVLFTLVLSIVISVSVQVVGVMLVAGLMILPAAASLVIAHSFKQLVLVSVITGETSVLLGSLLSLVIDISTGGAVIISAAVILLFFILYRHIRVNAKRGMLHGSPKGS
ncbi:metal ABC transporter permease [Tuberibacillus sp. Marseille-P3662]|uniref:metal ABC transporter permease n=1 Tax=Tuberibacillus sp. Marseille-P3662 TaxID=1965358 RepID=UPI0015930DC9|nr:metal ABC transporter permease [Tuberibacillus sp. Marseille-P3662]